MTRRPEESVQEWYERAIVNASIAAGMQESHPNSVNHNPAAFTAIAERVGETAADLQHARASLLAERASHQSPAID